jgi:hypothetical protein
MLVPQMFYPEEYNGPALRKKCSNVWNECSWDISCKALTE